MRKRTSTIIAELKRMSDTELQATIDECEGKYRPTQTQYTTILLGYNEQAEREWRLKHVTRQHAN